MVYRNNLSIRNQNNNRQLRNQRGGNNVEVLIYCNLKERDS
jgi:hypothetical protein